MRLKLLILVSIVLLPSFNLYSQYSSIWKQYYKPVNGYGYGCVIQTDKNNSIYISGIVTNNSTPGIDFKLVTIKYDNSGTELWKRFDGFLSNNIVLNSTLDNENNLYITGYTSDFSYSQRYLFLLKINSTGNLVWQKMLDSLNFGYSRNWKKQISIKTDSQNNIWLSSNKNSVSGGFLCKYNTDGNLILKKNYYYTGNFCLDEFNNCFITGNDGNGLFFLEKLNPIGNLIWKTTAENFNLPVDIIKKKKNIVVAGDYRLELVFSYGRLFLFDDSGAILKQKTFYNDISNITNVKFDNTNNIVITAGFNGEYNTLKLNKELDIIWRRQFNSINANTNNTISSLIITSKNEVFISGFGNMVHYNADGVQYTNERIQFNSFYDLGLNTRDELIVTGNGYHPVLDTGTQIYGAVKTEKLSENPVNISNTYSMIGNYNLSQNYPNPFNPATKISFSIPKSSFVKLNLYNILGQNIETLVNQNLNTGSYEVEWNATDYPSGVYFYKLETESFSEVKKMILKK